MIINKSMLALAIGVSLSSSAFASGFTPAPITTGTNVAGYCHSAPQVSTTSNVSTLGSNINSAISEMGSDLQKEMEKQIQSQKNLMNQYLQSFTDFLKKEAAAKLQKKYIDQTSLASTVSDGCDRQSEAGSVSSGLAASKAFKSTADAPATTKTSAPSGSNLSSTSANEQIVPVDNVSKAISALAKTVVADPKQWSANTVFDPTASDSDVTAAIAHMVEPMPKKGITDSMLNQPNAQAWLAANKVDQASTSLAVEALSLVSMGYRPTIDASTGDKVWNAAGFSGTMPGEVGGKISPMDEYSAKVQEWYNSPQFSADVKVKDETWQIKQQAMMMAAKLWAGQRENQLLERMVSIQSAMNAHNAKALTDSTNAARDVTVSQSLRGVSK